MRTMRMASRAAARALLAACVCGAVPVARAQGQPPELAPPRPAASAASAALPIGPGPVQLLPSTPLTAPAITRIEAPWHDSIDAFLQADHAHAPAQGGIVFVGSSTIRFWSSLETDFGADRHVVKRGFGGSRLSDCVTYLDSLVLPAHPQMVVVYAGDNDLAEGRTPADVLGSFKAFVEGVRHSLPETRIAYVSVKPSPLRASLLPAIRETNRLIAAYTHTVPNLDFIDVYSAMLGADGEPRPELFRGDMLHMNEAGYAIWKTLISTHLPPVPTAQVPTSDTPRR